MMARTINPDESLIIVDDDPAVRDALSVVFSLEGFDVETFASGDDFIAALPGLPKATVLLDVHMPGRSGMETLKVLDPEHYPAPIFIISGQGDINLVFDGPGLAAVPDPEVSLADIGAERDKKNFQTVISQVSAGFRELAVIANEDADLSGGGLDHP